MTDGPDTPLPNAPAQTPAETHPELRPELSQWCDAWKTALQNVLAQISGKPSAEADTFEASSQPLSVSDSDVWYTVVVGGVIRGELTLHLAAASGTRLAQKFLAEPEPAAGAAPAETITAENKEALEEILRQIAGLTATALSQSLGGEVQLHLSASAAPSWSSDAIVCLRTRDEAGNSVALEIQISPALATALHARAQPAPAQTPAAESTSTASIPASSYSRLMDVGLDVKLRFGTRRMLLRDVLALSAGVVIELDNTLQSPVDLLLDGRVIAQGDVVVVDGKYGLRVTEVIDRAPSVVSPG
ncbi:MAG: flagellar motor switch protein FliN [Terriglobales bacterium]